jgi:Zn finger protein HypA/HybF involved in hydrogenase expression
MSNRAQNHCRLCGAGVDESQLRRSLCPVCDEYAQHVALQSNKGLENIMGDLQNGPMFRAASKNGH